MGQPGSSPFQPIPMSVQVGHSERPGSLTQHVSPSSWVPQRKQCRHPLLHCSVGAGSSELSQGVPAPCPEGEGGQVQVGASVPSRGCQLLFHTGHLALLLAPLRFCAAYFESWIQWQSFSLVIKE